MNFKGKKQKKIKTPFYLRVKKNLSEKYCTLKKANKFFKFNQTPMVPPKSAKCFKRVYLFLIASLTFRAIYGCDIWKASDCMGQITQGEEEKMKDDDYDKDQLYKYCDKGKAYVDCVNSKLKCCDLKPELRGSLAAYEKLLEAQAWRLGPYCAGLGESNVVKYKCRTTVRITTSTSTKSSKPTLPPCQVEKV